MVLFFVYICFIFWLFFLVSRFTHLKKIPQFIPVPQIIYNQEKKQAFWGQNKQKLISSFCNVQKLAKLPILFKKNKKIAKQTTLLQSATRLLGTTMAGIRVNWKLFHLSGKASLVFRTSTRYWYSPPKASGPLATGHWNRYSRCTGTRKTAIPNNFKC